MYQIDTGYLLRRRTAEDRVARPRVATNVVLLGVVSMLTDISSEMVATVLPLYLVVSLGISPLIFGLIDGLYNGASAIVRIASGLVADRWQRHKEVATTGYGLSAIAKLGMLAAGGATGAIAAVVLIDRTGKGIRTAPRDAMISLSSSPATIATSFGVHRAMDTAGAMIGPLIAFGMLSLAPGAFDAIFIVSFFFAVIGVAVLVTFVDGRPRRPEVPAATRVGHARRRGTAAHAAGVPEAGHRRRRARDRDDQRRLPLPRAPAPPRLRHRAVPVALRRHRGGLHGPGHPGRQAGRPVRSRARVHRGPRPAARGVHVVAAAVAGLGRRCSRTSASSAPTTPRPTAC